MTGAAEAYERHVGRYGAQLAAGLTEAAGVHDGQRALDVGCGPGALTTALAGPLGPENVAAVDPFEPYVEFCRTRVPAADVRVGAAERLPFDTRQLRRRPSGHICEDDHLEVGRTTIERERDQQRHRDAFLAAGIIAAAASVAALVILPCEELPAQTRARPARRRPLTEVPPTHHTTAPGQPRRRADAERSVSRILDATIDALASDPEASMAEIARRAGVVRATIYVHFPTRESLIDAVTHRAITEASAVIEAAEPGGGDAGDALCRVVQSAWRTLGRYHGLVAINTRLPHAELRSTHHSVLATLEPLIERGQRDGSFRPDVPAAWHLSMLMALIHAASAEVRAGRLPEEHAEAALLAAALGAVGDGPACCTR